MEGGDHSIRDLGTGSAMKDELGLETSVYLVCTKNVYWQFHVTLYTGILCPNSGEWHDIRALLITLHAMAVK